MHAVVVYGYQPMESPTVKVGQEKLAKKKAIQIAPDADNRHQEQDKQKLGQQAQHIVQKYLVGLSQSVEDTALGGRQIEKGAEPGQGHNIIPSQGAVVKGFSHIGSEKEKKAGTQNAQI
jgi:hypothetical protein